MLRQSQLISLVDRALNQSSHIRKGHEAVYFCPFCNHYKKKLEVNVDTEQWHCWVCNTAGKSIRSLFKRIRVPQTFYNELYKITGGKVYYKSTDVESSQILTLPSEFTPLSKNVKSLHYGCALQYVKKRGLTKEDILRYNIGYCEYGMYQHRIIIPSYDKNGNINFFSARSYYDNPFKYKLPPWSKNIIGFEMFINWDEPITLTEGGFDAVSIRKNAIPLFGTILPNKLLEAIIENGVCEVNIVLDNDALARAVKIFEDIEKLRSQKIDVYLVRLKDKDPSLLGFEKIDAIINNQTKPIDFGDSIRLKWEI